MKARLRAISLAKALMLLLVGRVLACSTLACPSEKQTVQSACEELLAALTVNVSSERCEPVSLSNHMWPQNIFSRALPPLKLANKMLQGR